MVALKLTPRGDSVGVVLPEETLARLKLGNGDTVYLTDSPDGIRLTLHDPEFETRMAAARKIMGEHRDVLRQLAAHPCSEPSG